MCPAAVSAGALLLLAVLGSGLSPAQASDFTQCSHSFYKQSPPGGSNDGPLKPLCHSRPGGQSFATLYQPTCGSPVYSAFHLTNGLAASTTEEGAEPVTTEEESVKVLVPALLKGDNEKSELPPAASHLQLWDSAITTLVQTSIAPQCQTSGGDLYVLIGAGRLGAVEKEDCETKLLWSAVCCAAPEGKDSSSVAFISDTEGGQRQVSVKELEDLLGVTELFSEGCGGQNGGVIAEISQHEANTLSAVASETATAEDTETNEVNTADSEQNPDTESTNEQTEGSTESQVETQKRSVVDESAKTDQISPDNEESKVTSSESTPSDATLSSETVEEQKADDNSTSIFFYILSTTLSILKAPLHPVVSTITGLPGQVSYVLQEDLGVLSALPGDTYSVFHLLISDVFSWIRSVFNLVYDIGEACFSRIYYCTSSMGEALFSSCYTGVTGIGTLAGDTLGIFGDMFDNSWWLTKVFGGRLVEQSGDYVGTVVGELGSQTSAVGSGFGRLAWKSGNGVGYCFKVVWRIVKGLFDITFGIIGDTFERDSDRNEETFDIAAAVLPERTD
ncbi:hypothetical protein NL108_010938 [Boleophthalmus pectinirostris]|uniref:uncharacterized protein LOC110162462 n=1 Tax=Boleophthalmus pectinirostris TaxID=150288 RepID=UPI000A1C4F56|nr:uncharacterized protein LOC110162462 [Boleophthalmus pectinirostris]KAJ0066306.1 hypothetical protein NL108_010938 [Boleophthalmus pectinirostris]